ncbi:hypothetical protein BMI79_21790 [Serratia oryzae]|uniref:Uncharacterized protein n=1 Tax=Serratia oryzae TaxID=2034155 RepID=A0A1S8CDE5_9GAMM|nr:hypothetical protein [Serratia oryzae]OMQ18779.1 hypothetical protein BMI79_21790 [Serratia oryzae]
MATTVTSVVESVEYFLHSLYRLELVKTLRLNERNEKELLPLVRCYLLGYFADVVSLSVQIKAFRAWPSPGVVKNIRIN